MGRRPRMKTELTASEESLLSAWRAESWRVGTCCDPVDRPALEKTYAAMYAVINKPAPRVIWFDSPITAALGFNALKLHDSLHDSLGASLHDSLHDSLNASLSASLSASLCASLGASLYASLNDSLSASL